MTSRPTAREGLAEAADFARDVWRDCWPVMLVIVLGRTLVFMGHHVSVTEWRPWLWPTIGEVLSLAYIPLFGALYRLGVGGEALDSLGWGGFQWTGVEWRLLGVWIVLGFALAICAAPLSIISFPLLYLFQHHTAVSLGPFGGWSLASILLAPFWLAFGAVVLFVWGRLGLAAAATTARMRISPFASWSLTRGLGWTIGLAWLIAQLPMVIGWGGLWIMGVAEAGDFSAPAETWPLVDAVVAGLVVAALAAFIQIPLSVGLLSGFYRWLTEDAAEVERTPNVEAIEPFATPEDVAPLEEPHVEVPVVEEPADGPLSVWPHTVLPRGLFRPKTHEAAPHPAEPEPSEAEIAALAEAAHAQHLASFDHAEEPIHADVDPPLASAPEADQIRLADEAGESAANHE